MEIEERLKRLEQVTKQVCELLLDDAVNRDCSYLDSYDPIKAFIKEIEEEQD